MFGVYANCVSIKAERHATLAIMYPLIKICIYLYFFIFLFFIAGHIVIAILNSVIAHRTFSSYRAALVCAHLRGVFHTQEELKTVFSSCE